MSVVFGVLNEDGLHHPLELCEQSWGGFGLACRQALPCIFFSAQVLRPALCFIFPQKNWRIRHHGKATGNMHVGELLCQQALATGHTNFRSRLDSAIRRAVIRLWFLALPF